MISTIFYSLVLTELILKMYTTITFQPAPNVEFIKVTEVIQEICVFVIAIHQKWVIILLFI